jgi:hypothetical protein
MSILTEGTIFHMLKNINGSQEETEMTEQTKRKLRTDLTPEAREKAERVGRLPAGQRIKTAWSMRVEKFLPSETQH